MGFAQGYIRIFKTEPMVIMFAGILTVEFVVLLAYAMIYFL